MGKLGERQLDYNSDLDLIFLYDGDDDGAALAGGISAHEYYVQLGQRLIAYLSAPTAEGHRLPDRHEAAALGTFGTAGLVAGGVPPLSRVQLPVVGAAGAHTGTLRRRPPGPRRRRPRPLPKASPTRATSAGRNSGRSTDCACAWSTSWRGRTAPASMSRPGGEAWSTWSSWCRCCSSASDMNTPALRRQDTLRAGGGPQGAAAHQRAGLPDPDRGIHFPAPPGAPPAARTRPGHPRPPTRPRQLCGRWRWPWATKSAGEDLPVRRCCETTRNGANASGPATTASSPTPGSRGG